MVLQVVDKVFDGGFQGGPPFTSRAHSKSNVRTFRRRFVDDLFGFVAARSRDIVGGDPSTFTLIETRDSTLHCVLYPATFALDFYIRGILNCG